MISNKLASNTGTISKNRRRGREIREISANLASQIRGALASCLLTFRR